MNETQTKDILNVAKIVEGISNMIPKLQVKRPNLSGSGATHNGDTYEIGNLQFNLEGFKGTEKDGKRALDVLAKELRKRGKKN